MSVQDERTAIVIGGGIGGMAAALALIRRGWRVEVLERAAAFGEVGAGLSVWSNGVHALEALGLGPAVRDHSMPETQGGIRDVSGRWLARTDTVELARRYGPVVMIHRAKLLDILREALPKEALRPGVTVKEVRTGGAQAEVVHGDGVSKADLVVGADGIHSTVRRSIWPEAPDPRYAGYTAWRLVVDPDEPLTVGSETWGRGERVGLASLRDGRVYMFGVANAPPGQHNDDGLAELRRRFSGWHAPIPELLAAASPDAVTRHDIYEVQPLRTYVSGRVALLGDAAHAMTPNLGQGANQALEDAVTLAALLDAHPTVQTALTAYDRQRRPRTRMIASRSRRIGAIAQWEQPILTALRDGALRLTPNRAMLRSFAPVLGWRPPS